MKRSVAILGHTPQFVRWAIAHPCSLRQPSDRSLPDSSFRQLRGLREYSVALLENRVIEGVCCHPDVDVNAVEKARGFLAGEVLDAHGDDSFVAGQCNGCPANAVAQSLPQVWAGCYGLMAVDTGFEFDMIRDAEHARDCTAPEEQNDIAGLIEEVITQHRLADQCSKAFTKTTPRWYGIWKAKTFSSEQIELLLKIFLKIQKQQTDCPRDLLRFCDALKRCQQHGLEMEAELVPPGFSDGQTWTISFCCPECKFPMDEKAEQLCPACKRFGNPHEVVKNKVAGLRPYVFLNRVLGDLQTERLIKKLHGH